MTETLSTIDRTQVKGEIALTRKLVIFFNWHFKEWCILCHDVKNVIWNLFVQAEVFTSLFQNQNFERTQQNRNTKEDKNGVDQRVHNIEN